MSYRILFVSKHDPDAEGLGSEKRAFHALEALKRLGDVSSVVLARGGEDTVRLESGEREPHRRFIFHRPPLKFGGIPGWTLFRAWKGGYPARIGGDAQSNGEVLSWLDSNTFDLAFFFRWEAFVLLGDRVASARTVVDFDDIESKAVARQRLVSRAGMGRELSAVQWLASRRLDRIENRLLREVDAVTVCSEQDAVDLRSRSAGGARVLAAPNAIAVPAQMPARPQPGDGEAHSLLFVGAMSYAPNEDAVLFLVEEVWPLLRERFSGGLQLQVVGPDPSPRVRNAAEGAGVTVTGRVEKVAPYFRAAEVLLCPIRYGGGTRIKLLEAFANGVPVVSTSIGAEGLEARHDEQLLIADTAPAFAAACERILSDAPLADRLRASAFELVQRHYSAEVVQERLAEAVQDLLP